MAKGKTTEADVDRVDVEATPHPGPLPDGEGTAEPEGLVTVVAVERVFRRAENRYVEPGEEVALEPETAALLVELGVAVAAGTV